MKKGVIKLSAAKETVLFVIYVLQVCGETGSHTTLFRGRVDTDKNEVRLLDRLVNITREEEVASPRLADNVLKTGLINGQRKVRAIPCVYASLINVDNGNSDVGAFQGDDGACWTTCAQEIRLAYEYTFSSPAKDRKKNARYSHVDIEDRVSHRRNQHRL